MPIENLTLIKFNRPVHTVIMLVVVGYALLKTIPRWNSISVKSRIVLQFTIFTQWIPAAFVGSFDPFLRYEWAHSNSLASYAYAVCKAYSICAGVATLFYGLFVPFLLFTGYGEKTKDRIGWTLIGLSYILGVGVLICDCAVFGVSRRMSDGYSLLTINEDAYFRTIQSYIRYGGFISLAVGAAALYAGNQKIRETDGRMRTVVRKTTHSLVAVCVTEVVFGAMYYPLVAYSSAHKHNMHWGFKFIMFLFARINMSAGTIHTINYLWLECRVKPVDLSKGHMRDLLAEDEFCEALFEFYHKLGMVVEVRYLREWKKLSALDRSSEEQKKMEICEKNLEMTKHLFLNDDDLVDAVERIELRGVDRFLVDRGTG